MWLLCHSNNITFTPATGAALIPAERGTHRVVFILLSRSSAVLQSASHFISYSLSGATNSLMKKKTKRVSLGAGVEKGVIGKKGGSWSS